MIIYCVSFGSNWFRINHESGSSAWFNTSGIRRTITSARVRRRWTFRGSLRFNGDQFKWAATPGSLVGVRCYSPGVEQIENGEVRVLCAYPVNNTKRIDAYIVSIRSEQYGFIDRNGEWKSRSVATHFVERRQSRATRTGAFGTEGLMDSDLSGSVAMASIVQQIW